MTTNWIDEQLQRKEREHTKADVALEAAVHKARLLDARLPLWFSRLKSELTACVRTACDKYHMEFDRDISIREDGTVGLAFTKKRHPSSRLDVYFNAAAQSLNLSYNSLNAPEHSMSYDLALDTQGRVYLSSSDGEEMLDAVQVILRPFFETF